MNLWEAMKPGEDFFSKERDIQLRIWNLKVVALLFIILIFFCLERSREGTNWGKRKKHEREKYWGKRGYAKN